MTRTTWIEHMERTTGLKRPSLGGDTEEWSRARKNHAEAGCQECKARTRAIRANERRAAREGLLREIGLVKGRTALGRTIWE